MSLAITLEQLSDLISPVGGKLVLVRRLHRGTVPALFMKTFEFFLQLGRFLRLHPLVMPVVLARSRGTSTDDRQDVLGTVRPSEQNLW